jgi:PAS domain S-box-containing protein
MEVDWNYNRDSEGRVVGFRSVITDVTERKQADEALRASEEKNRSMIELSPDVIVVVNKLGVIVSCNSAVEKMSGYPREELVGRHFTKLDAFRLKDVPKYLSLFAKTLRGQVREPIEVDFVQKDGSSGTVEVRVSLLKDGNVQAIATNITERRRAEQALLKSEMMNRSLLEGSPVCNKIIDLDFKLRYMSAAGLKQLKIPDIKLYYGQTYPPEFYPESMRAPLIKSLKLLKLTDFMPQGVFPGGE